MGAPSGLPVPRYAPPMPTPPPASAPPPGGPDLPIDALRETILDHFARGPVVLSAPTGSGKSTRVPGWLGAAGPVVVVEPRRVAAQSLAARVAELTGATLGQEVGYVVRDAHRATEKTRVCFVTPGIALRWQAEGRLDGLHALVLDEFHERGMDLDLLLALAQARGRPRLLVMSATLDGDRIAAHLGGVHLAGEGRLHPVDIRHLPGGAALPDGRGLEGRVVAALRACRELPGDVLVFLPGKGEIRAVEAALASARPLGDTPTELIPLHGGLSLAQQRRVFTPGPARRVVLATNVAETSLTIPRIGVVVDAGLVRRTRYRGGRGFLTLLPVAQDAADQRAGRAGRLGPGVALRLWDRAAPLDPATPPELAREDLTPLVLAAAACGAPALDLPFLDPPQPYAVAAAREQLAALGALAPAPAGQAPGLSERGRRLFGLPLDAHLGRLLVEAEQRGTLDLCLPLCAGLSTSRPLFARRGRAPEAIDEADDSLGAAGCDAVALIRALRHGQPQRDGLDPKALDEARAALRRFARVFGRDPATLDRRPQVDRRALADTVLAAWPRAAHIKRQRKRAVAWANGGTELGLGRGSFVQEDDHEAILVLEDRAFSPRPRADQILITAAMPVPLAWLVAAGRGREQLAEVLLKRGQLTSRIDTVYAGRVIARREAPPTGALLREAVVRLVLQGRLFRGVADRLARRLERRALQARLADTAPPVSDPAEFLAARLALLGLEAPDELALLEDEDLLPDAIPEWERAQLDRDFPPQLDIGDARYRIAYHPQKRLAVLHQEGGARKTAPPLRLLPALVGWRIDWELKNRVRRLRG